MKTEIKNFPDLDFADGLIRKFQYYNKIKIPEFTVVFDYKLKWAGVWFTNCKKFRYTIFINPEMCDGKDCIGYSDDASISGVIVHEYCHFIDRLKGVSKKYKKEFPKNNLELNINTLRNREEACVECMALYIINPFLLKLIDKERYEFFRKQFRSPVEYKEKCFKILYKEWDKKIKKECERKWKLFIKKGKIICKK